MSTCATPSVVKLPPGRRVKIATASNLVKHIVHQALASRNTEASGSNGEGAAAVKPAFRGDLDNVVKLAGR